MHGRVRGKKIFFTSDCRPNELMFMSSPVDRSSDGTTLQQNMMQKRSSGWHHHRHTLLLVVLAAMTLLSADGFTICIPKYNKSLSINKVQQHHFDLSSRQPRSRTIYDRSLISMKGVKTSTIATSFFHGDTTFVLTSLLLVSAAGIAMEQKVSSRSLSSKFHSTVLSRSTITHKNLRLHLAKHCLNYVVGIHTEFIAQKTLKTTIVTHPMNT